MDLQSKFRLRNGAEIPLLGLGTWRAAEGEARQAVCEALRLGYRLIDTAAFYGNEAEVGAGLRDAGLPRSEVFVTSKVWIDESGYDDTLRAFEKSLARLGLDYLDMYMVHWPVQGLYKETYRAVEALYRQGRVKVIGVSNFSARLLRELDAEMEFGPMVDQLQYHPLYRRHAEEAYCRESGILLQAWKPLARGALSGDEGLCAIAGAHGKSPEQVLLRWGLQRGLGLIPKTVSPERLRVNADIFAFSLEEGEMAYIDGLDRGESQSASPDGVVLD